jgi:DNA-binding CsgD family transcriptional regulator
VRHQTLRHAIAWSYDLLEPAEQLLFERLSVFDGGFTLEAAAMCVRASNTGLAPASDIMEGIVSLVDKSLLRTLPSYNAHETRFYMLETVREFAVAQLAAGGEQAGLRRQHALFFTSMAEQAVSRLRGPEQEQWLAQLAVEHDNLRAALQWSVEDGEWEIALRLGGALWLFWEIRGRQNEGRAWLAGILTSLQANASPYINTAAGVKPCNAAGNLVRLFAAQTGWARTAHLAGVVDAVSEALSLPLNTTELALLNRHLEPVRNTIGEATYAAPHEAGSKWSVEQTIRVTLAPPDAAAPAAHKPATSCAPKLPNSLTARELEVLRMVANGLKNVQVADELVISPRTVDTHLVSIYSKLGVNSRSAATRIALEHNLA